MKKITLEQIVSRLNVYNETTNRIAENVLKSHFGSSIERIVADQEEDVVLQFMRNAESALEDWMSAYPRSPNERSALLRLAAAVDLALAIDELARGSVECSRIEKNLDEFGYPVA